jgi:MFS family permease
LPDPDPTSAPPPTEEPRATGPALEPELLTTELASTSKHDPYAALRSPNYRAFALGFVTSSTGLQMLSTGIAWEIYELTHDPLSLGFAGLARAVPVILFALPAGQAADIFNRKYILIATQTAFALLTAVLAAASWFYWHDQLSRPVYTAVIYAMLVLTGCARAFNGPSRNSLVPQIVEPEVFHNAVTWNSGVFQFSATGGPLIAGALIAAAHAAWPVYLGCALACLTFAISASFLRPRFEPRPAHLEAGGSSGSGGGGGGASILSRFSLRSMTAGAGHLWQEKTILAAITLDLFAVLLGGATALMPIYAKDILHVGPGRARCAPLRALHRRLPHGPHHRPPPAHKALRARAPSLRRRLRHRHHRLRLLDLVPLSLAMLILAGAVDNISVVIRHVLVQVRTPDHLRGRVSAVNSVFIESSNELGAFESGLVAKLFGPIASVVSAASAPSWSSSESPGGCPKSEDSAASKKTPHARDERSPRSESRGCVAPPPQQQGSTDSQPRIDWRTFQNC